MKFRVRRFYDRGVRLTEREFDRQEGVVGEVHSYRLEGEHVADLITEQAISRKGYPSLYRVALRSLGTHAMTLQGVEKHQGRRGVHEVYQEWHLTPAD